MKYIPSPISIQYNLIYSATVNKSGRMQYHRVKPGHSKIRISRTEFIQAYNNSQILAMRPLPERNLDAVFQFEFYV
ncbi:MAG: hypothetical protein AB7K37_10445 [Cyclobacteriaceae bacterium]